MKKDKTCCICGCIITGWPNNPWPVDHTETFKGTVFFTKEFMASDEYICCDDCNSNVVIRERLLR